MPDSVKAIPQVEVAKATSTISTPVGFEFGAVPPIFPSGKLPVRPPAPPAPPLGPLAAFVGEWVGNGFNTIFRPDSSTTPTPMPGPVTTTDPADKVLELKSPRKASPSHRRLELCRTGDLAPKRTSR